MKTKQEQENFKQTSMSDNEDYAFSIMPIEYTNKEGETKCSYKIVRYTNEGIKEYVVDGFTRIGFKGNNGKIHFYKKFINGSGSFDTL